MKKTTASTRFSRDLVFVFFTGVLPLLFVSRSPGNSYDRQPLVEIPDPDEIRTVESRLPATGPVTSLNRKQIREFLESGQRLNVLSPHLRDDRFSREDWEAIRNESIQFSRVIRCQGAFVTDDHRIFRWVLRSPRMLEILNYPGWKSALFFLAKPEIEVTIEGGTWHQFLENQGKKPEKRN